MRYLLDTNACITHLRSAGTSGVSRRITAARAGDIVLTSIVREELIFGALRTKQPTKSLAEMHAFLSAFDSLPFDDVAADVSGRVRAQLETAGERIEINDVLIAAVALSNNLTLVTHNVRHLSRVPGLLMEDWEATP